MDHEGKNLTLHISGASGHVHAATRVRGSSDRPAFGAPSQKFMQYAVAFILAGCAVFEAVLLVAGQGQSLRAGLVLMLALSAWLAWLLLARGWIKAAVWVLGGGAWAHLTLASFFLGGLASASTVIYPMIVLLGGWLIGARAAMGIALATCAVSLLFVVLESAGLMPAAPPTSSTMRWVIQSVVLVFSAALIAAVVEAYRERIDEVRKLGDDLVQLNASLEQRVRERTAQLQDANRQLESFSYTISHDLRAPLRGMLMYSELLGERLHGRLDQQELSYLERIAGGGHKLSRLIDDVLEYSRLCRSQLTRRTVDFDAVVAGVVDELRDAWPAAEVVIHPLGSASADPTMARQIFQNLISNALKYSAARSPARVEIGVRPAGAAVEYYVRDNGVGFDMQQADQLFTLFVRLHSDTAIEGTGAGLAIVKRLVEHHGGHIRAEAQPGGGATFAFSI